jgi:hypothetical protein
LLVWEPGLKAPVTLVAPVTPAISRIVATPAVPVTPVAPMILVTGTIAAPAVPVMPVALEPLTLRQARKILVTTTSGSSKQ